MAVTDPYATDVAYKARVGKTTGDNDTELASDLLAVSRYLDHRLGRFFTKDTAVVVRRYGVDGSIGRTLAVDDIASISGLIVKVDDNLDGTAETTLASTDYQLRPLNAAFGPEPYPWNQLYLLPAGTRAYWPYLVEVTAIYGWPTVPKAIERATIDLTSILRLESPRATSHISEGIDSVVGTSFEAQRIVDELSRVYAKPAWVFA